MTELIEEKFERWWALNDTGKMPKDVVRELFLTGFCQGQIEMRARARQITFPRCWRMHEDKTNCGNHYQCLPCKLTHEIESLEIEGEESGGE